MANWTPKLEKAEKYLEQALEHGRRVYRRYEDERENTVVGQRVNFFYSNVNIMKESLFNSLPKPDVSRVHRGDFQDDVARVAAAVVSRALTYEVACAKDFKEAIESAIFDRLVPGYGQVWIRFDVETSERVEDDDGEFSGGEPIPGTEQIFVDTVYWEDFLYGPARTWSKVPWVARRLHLTKGEMKETYGEDWESKLGGPTEPDDGLTPKEINQNTICVYEVWDKKTKKVYHVVKGAEEPLKELDDPYQLKGFFPCPKPLMANATTKAFLPITDYHIAQDQYLQLDTLYCRIQLIVEAIKVAGLYDSSNSAIQRMLTSQENVLIPVDNWAMHAEKGGARGQIDWFPVEVVSQVLQSLYSAFEATKAILFEITGMSDIVRGASNQYETAKAQQIKAEFASVRMNGQQRDVSIFVRDVLRIMAELFTQLYSDEKILQIIGQLPPNDMQYLPQAAEVLRSDVLSKYKVDIQTNSLTQADWALEKEQRMELVTTVSQLVGQMAQAAEGSPEMVELGVHLIKFAVAGYKAGTELESYIDTQLDTMATDALERKNNPQPPEPSPEEQKAQAEMQQMEMQGQLKQQELQAKMQFEQAKMQMDLQMKQAELAHKEKMAQLEFQIKSMELQMRGAEAQLNAQVKQQEAAIDLEVSQAQAAMGLEQKAASFDQQSQQKQAAFEQAQKQPKGKK